MKHNLHGKPTDDEMRALMSDTVEMLDGWRRAGIVHYDVKPDNLILPYLDPARNRPASGPPIARSGPLRALDFGFAVYTYESTFTRPNWKIAPRGTDFYMADSMEANFDRGATLLSRFLFAPFHTFSPSSNNKCFKEFLDFTRTSSDLAGNFLWVKW